MAKELIGWYGNTGASAINLAMRFGAKRIILLGYDLKLDPERRENWHENLKNYMTDEVAADPNEVRKYDEELDNRICRFQNHFRDMAKDLEEADLGIEILNATPDTALDVFPKVDFHEVIGEVAHA